MVNRTPSDVERITVVKQGGGDEFDSARTGSFYGIRAPPSTHPAGGNKTNHLGKPAVPNCNIKYRYDRRSKTRRGREQSDVTLTTQSSAGFGHGKELRPCTGRRTTCATIRTAS